MKTNNDGNFTKIKRWIIGLSGLGVAYCSIILTKQGVGITGELAWMGTVVALALFCAELMFNSNFEDLNWTILAVGIGCYLYSIWTNVEGLYFYRQIEGNLFSNFDVTNVGGGLFMDIYPELAIAWALKESKVGDLLGNLVKTARNPDKLTQEQKIPQNQPKSLYQNVPASIPQQKFHNNQVREQNFSEDEIPEFLKYKLHSAPKENQQNATYHKMRRQ